MSYFLQTKCMFVKDMYKQWLSGRMLDSRQRGPDSSLTSVTALCPCARHIYPSLVLVSTQEDMSLYNWKIVEWTKRIKSNKKTYRIFCRSMLKCFIRFWPTRYFFWSVRSLNSSWNQILYCLKILPTNCLQIYNLLLLVPLLFEHTLCHYEQNSTWWL